MHKTGWDRVIRQYGLGLSNARSYTTDWAGPELYARLGCARAMRQIGLGGLGRSSEPDWAGPIRKWDWAGLGQQARLACARVISPIELGQIKKPSWPG